VAVLRNVSVLGYVAFYQINKFFANVFFFVSHKPSLRPDEMASRAGLGLRAVFPLRCAAAQHHQTICAVLSHSRALPTCSI